MPIPQNEVDRYQEAITKALAGSSLSTWQRSFLANMHDRFTKDGTRTRLSDKQFAKLKETLAPYLQPREVPTRAPTQKKNLSFRPKPRRSLPSLRTVVRRTRTSLRSAILLIILVAGGLGAILSGPDYSGSDSRSAPTSRTVFTSANDFRVTDGDTVHLIGAATGTRLVGFNTPETFQPRCNRGLALGERATFRLKELIMQSGRVELRLVQCACEPGTQGTERCNFGRSCGVLRVDGHDVGDILIAEGLAARFRCGRTSCPPTPRPWCE